MKDHLLLKLIFAVCGLLIQTTEAQIAKCKGKYFGNINSGKKNYGTYWNQVTAENASKWQSTNPTKGVYNFGGSDVEFNWAKNNGGLFKYHCLMWGGQTAGWIDGKSSDEIRAEIPKYFKAVADHYNPMGGLKLIDVLNEPVNTGIATNLKNALIDGYKAEPANAGDINNQYGWAIWCFQLARKYFPNATLLINEYNIEMNWGNCRARYIPMTNAIKNAPNLTDGKKNLIDGVGLQCHGINNLSAANFKACLDEIWNKTGLPMHITEFDITAEPNEAKQRDQYAALIPVAWEHPHVAGITLWGYIAGETWVNGNNQAGPGGTGSGIIYGGNYGANPYGDRPAMTWLRAYMAARQSLSCCPAPQSFASCNGSNIPSVSISAPANNASFTQNTSITLSASATDADGTISNVKFYDGAILLSTDNSAPYSYSWTNASVGTHNIKAVATDNSGNTGETTITIKVNVPQGPFVNKVHPIPGVLQLEDYDVGGNGIAYLDNTPGSQTSVDFRSDEDVDLEICTDAGGGYNLGWVTAGEWLEYTVNVATAGLYDLNFRVAAEGEGRTILLAMDGTPIAGTIDVPNTGGWQTWSTVSVKGVQLKAGQQVLRLTVGPTDYLNANYIEFNNSVTTSIDNTEYSGVQLYPNPFHKEGFHIKNGGEFKYRITALNGIVCEEGQAIESKTVGLYLAPGVYLLNITNDQGTVVQKIVRQ